MADELSNFLMSGTRHAKLSPESLEMMGKQAANMFLNDGVSLNDAIAKLAGAHADINQEQVKRVCEFANTAVYLAKHDTSKTAGAESSYPQFPLADPSRIIQDLSDGARPTVATKTDIEYSKHPNKYEKVASAKADSLLSEMFGYEEKVKTASPDYSKATGETEVMEAKHSLMGLKDHLERTGERFDLMLKEAQESYYDTVKRHLLDGNDFADVMVAARSSGLEDSKVAGVMKPLIERLLTEKVASEKSLMQGVRKLEKVAHRVINEEHPLVTGFREVVSLEGEITKVSTGLGQVDAELKGVDSLIREQLRAGSSAR